MSRRSVIRKSTRESDEPVLGSSSGKRQSEVVEVEVGVSNRVTTTPADDENERNDSSSGIQGNSANRTEGVPLISQHRNEHTSKKKKRKDTGQSFEQAPSVLSEQSREPISMHQATSFPPVAETPASWPYTRYISQPAQVISSAPVTPYDYARLPHASANQPNFNFRSASAPTTPYNYGLNAVQGPPPPQMSNYTPGTYGRSSSNPYPSFGYTAPYIPSPGVYAGGAPEMGQPRQQSTASPGHYVPPPQPSHMTYYELNTQRQPDAFVANDPWRPHSHGKHQKDAETFDEIPLPQQNNYPPYQSQSQYPSGAMGNSRITPGQSMQYAPVQQPGIPTVIFHDVASSKSSSIKSHQPDAPVSGADSSDHSLSDYADMYMDAPESIPAKSPSPSLSSKIPTPAGTSSPAPSLNHDISQNSPTPHSLSITSVPSSVISPSYSTPHLPRPRKRTLLDGVFQFMKKIIAPVRRQDHGIEKPDYSWTPGAIPPTYIPYIPTLPTNFQPYQQPIIPSPDSSQEFSKLAIQFIFATLPRQIYLNMLLRLPSLYFSRVARIFEEADLTLPQLKKMALETASQAKGEFDLHAFESNRVPQYDRLKSTWESFIDSVMREWKTFNIISVLLLSAILTILQIDSAADDPVTRYSALFSLICALVSLLFGCIYIIRFGSMRKTYKAAEWALEAKRTKTVIWWNVWVMLAMPAIWLTWSIILYIACIMSYIWRTSPQDSDPPSPLSKEALLIIRIVISSILGLGLVYGALVLSTFRRYGEVMDRAWKLRIDGWIKEKMYGSYPMGPFFSPGLPFIPPPIYPRYPPPPPPHDYSYAPQSNFEAYQQPLGESSQFQRNLDSNYPAYPDFGPTYATADYVPPPEPYDSPVERSPRSTRSTQLDMQSNRGTGSRKNSADSYLVPDSPAEWASYTPSASLPSFTAPPLRTPSSETSVRQTQIPRRTTLAVPPPPHLPPIPGTPMSLSAASNASKLSSPGGSLGGPSSSYVQDDGLRGQEILPINYVQSSPSPTLSYRESNSASTHEEPISVHSPTSPQQTTPSIEIDWASQS